MVLVNSGAPRTSSATILASAAFAGPSAAAVRVQKAMSGFQTQLAAEWKLVGIRPDNGSR